MPYPETWRPDHLFQARDKENATTLDGKPIKVELYPDGWYLACKPDAGIFVCLEGLSAIDACATMNRVGAVLK